MRHFWICVSVVFLLLSNAVALHCHSMGLVLHAHPPTRLGEMTPRQAHHLREMNRHTDWQEYHKLAGDRARDQARVQRNQAGLAPDHHVEAALLASALLNGQLALRHYNDAMYHNAQVTRHHRLALGRPNL